MNPIFNHRHAVGQSGDVTDDTMDSSASLPQPADLSSAEALSSAGQDAGAAQASGAVTVASGSATAGLVINIGYDSSVTSLLNTDPTLYAEYTAAVQTAVQFYESEITNPITVTIDFGWGEVANRTVQSGGASYQLLASVPYSQLYTALKATDATSAVQLAAVASLPTTSPGGTWQVPLLEEEALGLAPANAANAASVGLGSATAWSWSQASVASGTADAVGVLEHEISEALGRFDQAGGSSGAAYTPLDLFRYTAADGLGTDAPGSAAGARDEPFVAGYDPNAYSYFSYNGTTVTLPYDTPAQVAANYDVADWNLVPGDPFDGSMVRGATQVSATDLQELNVLGYDIVSTGTSAGPSAAATPVALNQVVLHGSSAQYIVADDGGSLYIQDSVAGRDGTQTPPGVNEMVFADGVGLFDPTGSAEDVSRLYYAALNRAPDAKGLETWASAIDNSGLSLIGVANSFTASPEFLQDYGSLSDAAFVNQLYQNVLGRAADPSGAQYWDGALASGVSRGVVLVGFAESPENEAATTSTAGDTNNAEVYRLYQAALGRPPDQAGLTSWSSALANGATPTQVAQDLIGSPEFQQNYGTLSASDFVAVVYGNAVHRAPDPAGVQSWTSDLQQGTSEASVLVGVADSLEGRADTAAATHANWVFIPG